MDLNCSLLRLILLIIYYIISPHIYKGSTCTYRNSRSQYKSYREIKNVLPVNYWNVARHFWSLIENEACVSIVQKLLVLGQSVGLLRKAFTVQVWGPDIGLPAPSGKAGMVPKNVIPVLGRWRQDNHQACWSTSLAK